MQTIRALYDFLRYDIPYGVRNLIRFFPVVWNYRAWDYVYSLTLFRASLRHLKKALDKGMEVDETRLPKVAAMQRAITILDHIIADEYIAFAEHELGELSPHENWFDFKPSQDDNDSVYLEDQRSPEAQEHDRSVFDHARRLEEEEWKELWRILAGSEDLPGSDLRGWWD